MTTTNISLAVNGKTITMDKFTSSFVASVMSGILQALKTPAAAGGVALKISGHEVDIKVSQQTVPLNPFVNDFVLNTVTGMVSSLRDVEMPVNTLQLEMGSF
jgi:hypothetical protein